MQKNKSKEIKELIKKGFNLELISFEFDIPLEELKKYKVEIERDANIQNTAKSNKRKHENNKGVSIYHKVEKMRERYNELYHRKEEKEKTKTRRILTQEEVEFINKVIDEIQAIIDSMKDASKKEKNISAIKILKKVNEIRDLPLTIEQLEKINCLIRTKELDRVNIDAEDRTDLYISKKRKSLACDLAEAIDIKQATTDDLSELEKLKNKITFNMVRESQITVGSIRSRIEMKISRLQQQKAVDRIRNEIPLSIEKIIIDLAQGILDIENAKHIISEEVKIKVNSKPKNKFSLTEEQEEKQILTQIRTALREKIDKYNIINPKATIEQLQELTGNLETSIDVVISNLISKKEFEKAKEICTTFYDGDRESEISIFLSKKRREIKNAEIGDMIVKGITREASVEQDIEFFTLIEKGLYSRDIKPGAISLGKSQDGLKNITLADILEDEIVKGYSRR